MYQYKEQTSFPQQSPFLEKKVLETANVESLFKTSLAERQELLDVFRLRYDTFFREHGMSDVNPYGLEFDEYDVYCDHLIVRLYQEIVGTYRLLPFSRLTGISHSYAEKEFKLATLREQFGKDILELGRSCIHKDYRNGTVVKLLLQGVYQYFVARSEQIVIGCVSIHDLSHMEAAQLKNALQAQGHWDSRFDIEVENKFLVPSDCQISVAANETIEKSLPPLMKGYLRLGAKICGGPAWDEEFKCHDFLMILERNRLDTRFARLLTRRLG